MQQFKFNIVNHCSYNTNNPERVSLSDLISTNRPHTFKACGVLPLDLSDHCANACLRDTRLQKSQDRILFKGNFKHFVDQDFYISNILCSASIFFLTLILLLISSLET